MKKYVPIWVWPLVLCFAVGTVWIRLRVIDTTYQINQAEQQIQNAKREDEKLELKVSQLRSPRRLEALAKNKFKLQPPKTDQVIRIYAHPAEPSKKASP